MPFSPIPTIGAGAGAAAGLQDVQQQQNRQGDFVAQLLMHMQQMQAQREATAAYRQGLLQDREARTQDQALRTAATQQGRLESIVNQIPQGTDLPSSDVQSMGSAAIGRFSPLNTLPSQQTGGLTSLPAGAMSQITGPSTSGTGTTGETQVQTMSSPPQPTGMSRKLPSDVELERESRDRATEAQRQFTNTLATRRTEDTEGRAADTSAQGWQRITDATARAIQAQGSKGWDLQKATDKQGNDTWVRINKDTGEVKSVNPSEFAPPKNATTATRLASAQAVNQTGEDIINQMSDPKFASAVGPAMGRFNSLRDFVGNPPPEYAQLAGQIESYALASMGVHGMRSTLGAQKIADLLNQKHTPESLVAAIKGLNAFSTHFMQNEGRGAQLPTSSGGRIRVTGPNGESGTVPAGTSLPAGWKAQ